MSPKYRAVVCDVDGTILDQEHQMPCQLIELVNQLQQKGVIFTLASARPALSLYKLARELQLVAPVIALNGSLILDSKREILYNRQFLLQNVANLLREFPQTLVNSYVGYEWIANRYTENIRLEEQFVRQVAKISQDFPSESNMLVLMDRRTQLLKIQAYICDHEPLLNAVFSADEYLHIAAKNTCKASGLEVFCGLYQLELSDFIAFGDGENDISMLRQVGHGVAMGNARDEVKQVADAISDTNINLGVVKYLRECLNQNLI